MPLILAIDPDKRQGTQLANLVRAQLQAELVQRATAADGLDAIGDRVPDLVLTSPLISPREDAALAAHLRQLGAAAAHVQTVTIPLLGAAMPTRARGGMLSALRREKPPTAMTDGCAPEVFAEQVRQYLATAEEQRCLAHDAPLTPTVPEAYDDFEAPAGLEASAEYADYEEQVTLTEPEPMLTEPAALEPPAPVAAGLDATLSAAESTPQTFVSAAPDDEFGVEEPAALPLAQLLEMVSSWSPRHEDRNEDGVRCDFADYDYDVEAEAEAEAEVEVDVEVEVDADVDAELMAFVGDVPAALAASPEPDVAVREDALEEDPLEDVSLELLQDTGTDYSVVPVVELPSDAVAGDALVGLEDLFLAPEEAPVPAAGNFVELYVDPVAARALEELSLQVPVRSLGDSLFAEPPVPVVEIHSFQSLDSIANELAAAPARPAFEPLDDLASLFAAKPARPAKAGYQAPEAIAPAAPPDPVGKNLFQSLFVEPARDIPMDAGAEVPDVDPSLFAAARPVFAATMDEPEPITVFEVAPPAPIAAMPVSPAIVEEPVAAEPVADWFAIPEAAVTAPVSAEAVADWFAVETVVDEPPLAQAIAIDAVAVDTAMPIEAITSTAAVAPSETETPTEAVTPIEAATPIETVMPVVPMAIVAPAAVIETAPPEPVVPIGIVEEPADVADAIWPAAPVPVAPVVAEAPFTFTFVDGFGDELRDFEMTPDAAVTEAPASPAPEDTALPVLDEEALSLIGDAARKASLDALVIEEFERGLGPRRPARKPKPKRVHAGATQIVPPVDRVVRKKAPVDEWGMFDPEQCGFAALDDDESVPDGRPARDGSRSRIIPY
jgi:hypothetical protein